jgi:phosphoglycerate kinase
MAKVTIRDLDLRGKLVLVRVDFNVPLETKKGELRISDETRIRETLPTLYHLIEQGARTILISHLGRPRGKSDPSQSLLLVAVRLGEMLRQSVSFAADCIGFQAQQAVSRLKPGGIVLLENVRFHPGDEANDPEFARQLLNGATVFINDAFGVAHRAHASTVGVAQLVKEKAIGFLMEKELKYLDGELSNPQRPFVVILGGAKVSDKIKVIDRLLDRADTMLIGGAMAYTFFLAQGKKVGKSLVEPDQVNTALAALKKAKEKGVKFLLPVDNMIAEKVDFAEREVSPLQLAEIQNGIPDGWEGVDIGPQTRELYREIISEARTVLWNGPMGIFEIKPCAEGTFAIAEYVAKNRQCVSIIGGGDSVKAVNKAGYAHKMTFISTGGGASLEFLEGKELPGLAAIPDR